MKRSELLFGIFRIPVDAIAIGGALLLAYFLRLQNIDLIPGIQLLDPARTLPDLPYYVNVFLIRGVLLFLLIAAGLKLYMIRVTLGFFREESRIILTTVVWVGAIMGWFFFVRKQLFFSRILLLHATLFAFLFVSFGRMLLTLLQRELLRKGIGVRTVLSIGSQQLPSAVAQFLGRDARYHYLGHLPPVGAERTTPLREHHEVDLVLQTDPNNSDETNFLIDYCRSHNIGYAFLPPVLVDVPHLLRMYRFGSVPVLRFHPTPLDGWGSVLKRTGDIIFAAILLVLLSPLFLLVAFIIKMDSRGPVLYRSKRIAQGRMKSVTLFKFRSMVQNADTLKEFLIDKSHRTDGPLFKIKNDPRITRFGKLLRRFSIDELPQLWNVLKGDLSLVGPRPHLPEEVQKYTDFQMRVFAVKPGLTGLAQISGRSDLKFDEEVRLDLQYIEEWSPFWDMWILWRTVRVVLRGEGAD